MIFIFRVNKNLSPILMIKISLYNFFKDIFYIFVHCYATEGVSCEYALDFMFTPTCIEFQNISIIFDVGVNY